MNLTSETEHFLPDHLSRYIVEQDFNKYSAEDHALWRFLLRRLTSFLKDHAHPCYLEGLTKTGISLDRIPSIAAIDQSLAQFGWRAVPVSGFIPPAAFMELQAHSVLPIASDMRSLAHLDYTPAPDIVHEAAGHAPILIHPEFAQYLKNYAQIAKRAILHHEDLRQYELIRLLSDLKETSGAELGEVRLLEQELNNHNLTMGPPSEAALLSRMNWWTAEYGLIGNLSQPKIYGAGLLSSLGESQLCLKVAVKKIPLTKDCINYSYDITEPQPQLFVAADFSHLSAVLEELADEMSFRQGGTLGCERAISAKTVNTLEFASGLQFSGFLHRFDQFQKKPSLFEFRSDLQVSVKEIQIERIAKECTLIVGPVTVKTESFEGDLHKLFHEHRLKGSHSFAFRLRDDWQLSGRGELRSIDLQQKLLCFFEESDLRTYLFLPENNLNHVFGGPADRKRFGPLDEFEVRQVKPQLKTDQQQKQDAFLLAIQLTAEMGASAAKLLKVLAQRYLREFPDYWIAGLELFQALKKLNSTSDEMLKHLDSHLLGFKTSSIFLKNEIVRDVTEDL